MTGAAFSRRLVIGLMASAALFASGCTTTGQSFDTSGLPLIVAGQTTLPEAVTLLQSEPVDIYRQLDGSAMARWAHKATLATDAIYFNRELWLAFGSDGRFSHVVKSDNVPRAHQFGGPGSSSAPVYSFGPSSTPAHLPARAAYPAAADSTPGAYPASVPSREAVYQPATSYPLVNP